MYQQIIQSNYNNKLEEEINKLFHSSNLPLHFNKTGNKEFTNYQRISIIILFQRSKKSLRDFVLEFRESKWTSWLGLKKIPKKSTLHDWLNIFNMKIIRKLSKVLLPKEINLTSIDGTGFDSWIRSRQYARKIGEPYMPYAKADLFIDVKTLSIIDFSLINKKTHDVKIAEKIFNRTPIKGFTILADKGYDSEPLHEMVRKKGAKLFAPVRNKSKKPKGRFRKSCKNLPEFMGLRSLSESVNSSLKRRQIISLKSKKLFMKQREFGWQVVLYNIQRKLIVENNQQSEIKYQTFFYLIFIFVPFRTEPLTPQNIKKDENKILYTSRSERIKSYAIYAFAVFCIGVIVLLVIDKNGR